MPGPMWRRRDGLGTCAKLNQALLTSIGSINEDLRDYAACGAMKSFLESEPVWMPSEGRFEPLLQMDFLDAFEAAGQGELMFVPEFPGVDAVEVLRRAAAERARGEISCRGERWRRWMSRFC